MCKICLVQFIIIIKSRLLATVKLIWSGFNQHSGDLLEVAKYLNGTVLSMLYTMYSSILQFHCIKYCTYHWLHCNGLFVHYKHFSWPIWARRGELLPCVITHIFNCTISWSTSPQAISKRKTLCWLSYSISKPPLSDMQVMLFTLTYEVWCTCRRLLLRHHAQPIQLYYCCDQKWSLSLRKKSKKEPLFEF